MKITVDFLDADQQASIAASAASLFKKMKECQPEAGGWNCQELIWPALKNGTPEPELVLLPLDRVGAEQGFGGSYVMIGYFVDQSHKLYPSRPLVVKLSKPTEEQKEKLKREWQSGDSIRAYVAYHRDSFALPLHFDELEDQRHAVLWSPFSSSEWIWSKRTTQGNRLKLQVRDFWRILRKDYVEVPDLPDCDLIEVIRNVYRLTQALHDRNGTAIPTKRRIFEEYEWYIRGFRKDTGWGKSICDMWRGETIEEFNGHFFNPIHCIDALRSFEASIHCGAVHGDLHPRNIVFTENNVPNIIDFGWAADERHIVKDFVLMECNLRFVAFRPDIELGEVALMANWIGFDEKPPETSSEDVAKRLKLIGELRAIARARISHETNWDEEYIIPLFLVAFGLLRVLTSMDNQIAARVTTLKLATYLKEKLNLQYGHS